MSKLPLDLSKFRKVGSDKNTSTFRHYEGHEIKIAHSKLSSKLRAQLDKMPVSSPKKMADGGPVEGGVPVIADEENSSDVNDAYAIPSPPPQADQTVQTAGFTAPIEASNDPYGINANADAQIKALNEQRHGQQGVEIAKGKQGLGEATQEGNYQDRAENQLTENDISQNLLDTERENNVKDINNFHINPNRVIENMSTGRHILNAIGLVLGGFGQGLVGGSNPAYDYIQGQISRDVDAQKAELGKKENLLSHNIQATQSLHAGEALTRLQMNDILSSHLRQEAAKSANPIAQAELLNIAGKTDAQSAVIRQNARMQNMMMGNSQTQDPESQFQSRMQYLRMNNGESMAKDLEAKHLPGVSGRASVEITPDNRKEWVHLQNLDKSYADAQEYLNNVSNLGAGWQNANKARGVAIAKSLELEVGQLEGLGRFTPEEAKRYKDLIPDLGGTHFTDQDTAKLTQLQTEVSHHKASLLGSLGLQAPAASAAPVTQTRGGVKYQKVPGGWKKVG